MPDGKHPGDPAAEVGVHEGSVDTTSAALICEISTLLKLAGNTSWVAPQGEGDSRRAITEIIREPG